ncbi:MAG: hypothetical protein PHQ66_02330 [Candidatus Nanoarchaeia archaeon]|nr:hypothetical protein [Candidatus Nanoarchaeia archaeon]MDD5357793.1 hypothetical protein [Candidatus Nanoarchaeia archaeon]MDD5588712.1 hypothetical protein [Candidatus Nanoarchaeia archaeon]
MKKEGFNNKTILIFLVIIGIIFISSEIKADNFAYTNGSYIYSGTARQFYAGINYITNLVWTNSHYGIPDEEDIQRIKNYNFNAIRLPLSTYQLKQGGIWNSTTIGWLNNTINWSKSRNISVLLDLHSDNSNINFLFGGLIERNQTQWDELASFWSYLSYLYKNETTIIGYDLINEPYFYKPFRSDVNRTAISNLWIQWVNETYENDFDKLNKSWNGVATFTTFDNATNYENTTDGLLMYWQMDNNSVVEDSYIYDWTGNNNNGTITSAIFNASGKIKGVFDFYGTQQIASPIGLNNYSLTQFSMVFWLKCIYDQPLGPKIFMAYRNSTNYAGAYVYLYPANGGDSYIYTLFLNSSGSSPLGLINSVKSSSPVCDDEWKHIVYQYNGTQAQLYLDGKLDDSYDITSDITNITKFQISYNSAFSNFNGSLDEVMFFNRSLNFSEIWAMSQRHKKYGDLENFSTIKIPSVFLGYDNDERHHTSPNIFQNPSFESWADNKPASWTNYTPVEKYTEATDGSYSVKINRTDASSIMYQIFQFTTEPNWSKDLLISFDAKVLSSGQNDCYLRIACSDSYEYNELMEKDFDFSNTSWNSYLTEWEIDPRFDSCQFEFYSSGTCAALIDNINVSIEQHNNRLTDFYKFLEYRYKLFIEYLITEIRKNDTNHMIFFDSLGTSNGFHTSVIPMDFALPNDSISNKLGYSPHHYYDPANYVEGWGYLMESYKTMNIPWITAETGYLNDYFWREMIIKTSKYRGSGYFHWGQIGNVSAFGYGATTEGEAYYCNNISSIQCSSMVSGIVENNLSITPKGIQYKNFLNKFFSNQHDTDDDILFVYGDGSYNFRDAHLLNNPFRGELDKYDKSYNMISADNLVYNTSFENNNYLNVSYYNHTSSDQTKINWTSFDKILVVQNSYRGSARLGYLLEDMMKADKRVAFIGTPYVIQYPYYDFRQDGYLGNGKGEENTNYSFTYWFNSTVIPNSTDSRIFNLTAEVDFYDIKAGQRYTFISDSGYLMNVSLPEGASWIFKNCSWNKSNQLYLCGVPQFAGGTYEEALIGDTINITQSILKWLYQDDSLEIKSYPYNMTYLPMNTSDNKKSYAIIEKRNSSLIYNLTFPYNTKVWNFINKTIECENCNSLNLSFNRYEMKMFFINISNISLTEGNIAEVRDDSNNIVDDNVEVWFTGMSDNSTKHIDSNLTSAINLTANFYVDSCSISSIYYVSETGTYSKTYGSSEWNCSGNMVTLNITGIEPATGSNMIYITYKTSPAEEDIETTTGNPRPKNITINNGSISPEKDYVYKVHKFDKIFFILNNVTYTITITQIGNGFIDLEIEPSSIDLALQINESRDIDLNGDKPDDISITLIDIKSGTAKISIKLLENKELPYSEKPEEKLISTEDKIVFILGFLIILILIIIILLKIKVHSDK